MNQDESSSGGIIPSELEEIAEQPGTYYNPRTEVTVVVDDSGSIDQAAFPETDDGTDWIRISEEPAIDEQFRDELLERFETAARNGSVGDDPESFDSEDFDREDDEDGEGFGSEPELED